MKRMPASSNVAISSFMFAAVKRTLEELRLLARHGPPELRADYGMVATYVEREQLEMCFRVRLTPGGINLSLRIGGRSRHSPKANGSTSPVPRLLTKPSFRKFSRSSRNAVQGTLPHPCAEKEVVAVVGPEYPSIMRPGHKPGLFFVVLSMSRGALGTRDTWNSPKAG